MVYFQCTSSSSFSKASFATMKSEAALLRHYHYQFKFVVLIIIIISLQVICLVFNHNHQFSKLFAEERYMLSHFQFAPGWKQQLGANQMNAQNIYGIDGIQRIEEVRDIAKQQSTCWSVKDLPPHKASKQNMEAATEIVEFSAQVEGRGSNHSNISRLPRDTNLHW